MLSCLSVNARASWIATFTVIVFILVRGQLLFLALYVGWVVVGLWDWNSYFTCPFMKRVGLCILILFYFSC